MSKRHSAYSVQMPSRRAAYRAAKRLLIREARRVWRVPVHAIERRVRAFLRGKSRAYLLRLLARPAMALALVTSIGLGRAAHAEPPIELAQVAAGNGGFVINGIDAGDNSGFSASGAGDVNGDGIPDVVVGAWKRSPEGNTYTGESYVVFGKADRAPVNLADIVSGTGGFVINGIDIGDYAGWSVSGAGDVNGDGLDDLVVGAPGADPDGDSDAGESYVVFGKATTTAVNLSNVASGVGGFAINGIDPSDGAARVSGAGDVNGDGLDDLIVGAAKGDPGGRIDAGESYVVFGKVSTTAVELSDVAAGTGGFIINGLAALDYSGVSVSSAGDVNGDGLADVIVGASEANMYTGESYVVFGKASTTPVDLSDVAAGTGGFIISGLDGLDHCGNSVSGAGDVNGDGLADVIVGAWGADPSARFYAGESYVVFGKASTTAVDLIDIVLLGVGGFVINGIDSLDVSGVSVSGAGDVNGDGLADVIVGASLADPGGRSAAGESYVVFGKASTSAVELSNVAAGSGGFVINGIDASDRMGDSVSGAGDVNGDGLADLIVGAWLADPGGNGSAGESYVVFSPVPNSDNVFVDFNFAGTELGNEFNPFNTLTQGIAFANGGATINLDPGTSPETFAGPGAITTPLTLKKTKPGGGPVIIGQIGARSANKTGVDTGFVSVDRKHE